MFCQKKGNGNKNGIGASSSPLMHVESLYVSGKLPTHSSPKPLTLTLTSHLGRNVGLREG